MAVTRGTSNFQPNRAIWSCVRDGTIPRLVSTFRGSAGERNGWTDTRLRGCGLPYLSSMASPPIPPAFEPLLTRPFSFYPPIVGIEHNEWLFRKATWSEILVVNCKSSAEIWIPRRFMGEVSRIDDPVLIVGLNRELEFKAGTVWPYQRRVIEMP